MYIFYMIVMLTTMRRGRSILIHPQALQCVPYCNRSLKHKILIKYHAVEKRPRRSSWAGVVYALTLISTVSLSRDWVVYPLLHVRICNVHKLNYPCHNRSSATYTASTWIRKFGWNRKSTDRKDSSMKMDRSTEATGSFLSPWASGSQLYNSGEAVLRIVMN